MQQSGARSDHATRLRSLLPSWAGLTAALLALSLVAIAGAETLLVHTSRADLARHARLLASPPRPGPVAAAPLTEGTLPPDRPGLDADAERLHLALADLQANYPDILGLAIYERVDRTTLHRCASAGGFEFATRVETDDRHLATTTPLPNHEVLWTKPEGDRRLAVAYPAGMLRVESGALRSTIALTGLGILIAGLLASYSLASRVTGRLQNLRVAMDRAAAGDLDTRVDQSSNADVVAEVSTAFNHFAANVAAGHHRAHAEAAELEAAVANRTRELTEAYEKLRALDRAKERFLSSISHEMRTPLTSIIAAVEILESFAEEDPAARHEFLGIVRREAHRLSRQITDLLDLARIEAQHLALTIKEVDLCQLIDDTVCECAPLAEEAGVAIVVSKPKLPIRYRCDRQRIGQVIANLIDNAIKFSPPNGSVWIALKHEGNRLAIRVRDEGDGVPPDQRERLFDQFEQTEDILCHKPRGMGIGLPISLRIVQIHGGTLEYEEGIRRGAQFVARLPGSEIVPDQSADSVTTYRLGCDSDPVDGGSSSRSSA